MGLGEKSSKFKAQSHRDLTNFHRHQNTLFTDPAFPPVDAILAQEPLPQQVVWKRPQEMVDKPRLYTEGDTILKSGTLSCDWFVGACAVLASLSELRNKVIPDYWNQEFGEKYCGLFHFKFWRFGSWQEVVVDDHLPTSDNQCITSSSTNSSEFWPSLLEKAYAKLHGSYEALREGELCDALVDFTGGVSEVIDIQAQQLSESDDLRNQFLDMLITESADHSIVCFNVAVTGDQEIGSRTELGLVRGHSYLMTDVRRVYLGESGLRSLFRGREKVAMIRLRNQREDGIEAPKSPDSAVSGGSSSYAFSTSVLINLKSRLSEWQHVRDSEKQRLGLLSRDNFEFWMPLEDVVAEFTEAVIVRLVTGNVFALGRRWRASSQVGKWEANEVDRSNTPSDNTFLNNPQYLTDINTECEILLQLMQYNCAVPTQSPSGRMNLLIGLHIIQVEENRKTRVHKLWPHQETLVTQQHRRKREVTYRGRLYRGRHLIVPSTYRQSDSASFLLRLISTSQVSLRPLSEDIPSICCSCIRSQIEWVTVITIKNAESLCNPENEFSKFSNVNPYCVIECEGTKVKTEVAKNNYQPIWDKSYIFYRIRPSKPIVIKMYTHNSLLRDKLIGECEVPAAVTHRQSDLALVLRPKMTKDSDDPPSDSPPPSSGTLHVVILTEDNLQAI